VARARRWQTTTDKALRFIVAVIAQAGFGLTIIIAYRCGGSAGLVERQPISADDSPVFPFNPPAIFWHKQQEGTWSKRRIVGAALHPVNFAPLPPQARVTTAPMAVKKRPCPCPSSPTFVSSTVGVDPASSQDDRFFVQVGPPHSAAMSPKPMHYRHRLYPFRRDLCHSFPTQKSYLTDVLSWLISRPRCCCVAATPAHTPLLPTAAFAPGLA